MADVDFNINIRTIADTSGIKLTTEQLKALKIAALEGNAEATSALQKLTAASRLSNVGAGAGFGAATAGIATIVTTLTLAINKWKAFNDEQDRMVERMIKATEKSHELGLAVADMLDAMKSAERIDTEPLEFSFERLRQRVASLKTEIQEAFATGQYEEVKKLISQLGVVESQLDRVTSSLERQAAQAKKTKEANAEAADKAATSSTSQVQRVLANEQAAAKARAEGKERDAELFQKSSEAFEKGIHTPQEAAQLAEARRLRDLANKPLPPLLPPPIPTPPKPQSEPKPTTPPIQVPVTGPGPLHAQLDSATKALNEASGAMRRLTDSWT